MISNLSMFLIDCEREFACRFFLFFCSTCVANKFPMVRYFISYNVHSVKCITMSSVDVAFFVCS
jgi:hypothetical protein